MAARAMWKGVIRCGSLAVPVKLYAAVQDRDIHFHLLHDQDMVRVQQRMVNPNSGEVVPHEQIRRGLQVDEGRFVLLQPEELEGLEPEGSRDIEITRMVAPERINHQWYERPYYLGPDEGAAGEYSALLAALEHAGREGVARWVMRKKEYIGALRVARGSLMLIALRHVDEVVPASALEAPEGRALDARELAMEEQLVEALADRFDPSALRYEYRARVEELITRKSRGEQVPLKHPTPPRRPAAPSLAETLAASLRAVREAR